MLLIELVFAMIIKTTLFLIIIRKQVGLNMLIKWAMVLICQLFETESTCLNKIKQRS